MNCARVRQQIVDSLALNEAVEADVAVHLGDCPGCRGFYEEQSLLFVSMDRTLAAIANAPVPPSLLPAVRSSIQAPQNRPVVLYGWLSAAGAAAVVACAILIAQLSHVHAPLNVKPSSVSTTATTTVAPALHASAVVPSVVQTRSRRVEKSNHFDVMAEVVFDRREAADLARLADSIRQQPAWGQGFLHRAPLPPEEMKPLPAIEIAQLDVKPLSEQKW